MQTLARDLKTAEQDEHKVIHTVKLYKVDMFLRTHEHLYLNYKQQRNSLHMLTGEQR